MLKPFVMSVAFMGLGASAVGLDGSDSSPATWRWQVSQILDAQRSSSEVTANVGALDARSFDQRYERYSTVGLPEPTLRSNPK
jgi:hypothetical protein